MVLEDTVWFIPFDADTRVLQSVYAPAAPGTNAEAGITDGRAFTVSLETVKLSVVPQEPWVQHLLHPNNDLLILTSSALGSKPLVERLHYYASDINVKQPLVVHDLLSDIIWVCDDYQAPDTLYIELSVVTMDRLDEQRTAVVQMFNTLASTSRSIFPVALPYLALGEGVLKGLSALWQPSERRESYRISEPLKLFSPGTPQAKTLRVGHYVIMSEPIDGTQYELGDGNHLATAQGNEPTGKQGAPLSYAVLRIDPVKEVPMDSVVSQHAATLLTQLHKDRDGQSTGMVQTSFGALTDTLTAYTNFTYLQRYQALMQKGDQRTPGETEQMQQIEQREALKPFLPQSASAPSTAAASTSD